MIGCILITSNLSSIALLPRVGPRALIAAGMLLGAGGMVYLTQVSVTVSYVGGVLPALLILGLGFGLIFAPAINTATTGIRQADSGVASALVNTMQQVGGSIGTSALSTVALTVTASYLVAHHTSSLAPAIAPHTHYTLAFAVSAALLGLRFILAVLLCLRSSGDELGRPPQPPPRHRRAAIVFARRAQTAAARPGFEAIPVALCSCSPVVSSRGKSVAAPAATASLRHD